MNISEELLPIVTRYTQDVPVKLGALATALGIHVFKSTLKPGISGLIEPSDDSPSGYQIKINRHEPVERQRFTLAHEISHFILHRFEIGPGLIDDTLYRSKLSDRKEVEANKLASQIVMPSSAINAEFALVTHLEASEKIEVLAKKFRVSKEAMRIRLGY